MRRIIKRVNNAENISLIPSVTINRFTKYHTLSGNDENNPAISTDLGSSDARTGTNACTTKYRPKNRINLTTTVRSTKPSATLKAETRIPNITPPSRSQNDTQRNNAPDKQEYRFQKWPDFFQKLAVRINGIFIVPEFERPYRTLNILR